MTKNQSYLADFGKVFFAAAYVGITSPVACAVSVFPTTTEQKLNNSPNQQLVASDEAEDLPLSVKSAVLQDISQRAEVEISALRVVKAQQQSWLDGYQAIALLSVVSALLYKALVSTQDVADISSLPEDKKNKRLSSAPQLRHKAKNLVNQGIGNGAKGCEKR